MDVIWDLVVLASGYLLGVGTVVAVLMVSRIRLDARREGDRLVDTLGPIGSQRFLEAARD